MKYLFSVYCQKEYLSTPGMLEIFTLNADHEIEVTVSVASAVKIIPSRNLSSLVKMCFISLNAMC